MLALVQCLADDFGVGATVSYMFSVIHCLATKIECVYFLHLVICDRNIFLDSSINSRHNDPIAHLIFWCLYYYAGYRRNNINTNNNLLKIKTIKDTSGLQSR